MSSGSVAPSGSASLRLMAGHHYANPSPPSDHFTTINDFDHLATSESSDTIDKFDSLDDPSNPSTIDKVEHLPTNNSLRCWQIYHSSEFSRYLTVCADLFDHRRCGASLLVRFRNGCMRCDRKMSIVSECEAEINPFVSHVLPLHVCSLQIG